MIVVLVSSTEEYCACTVCLWVNHGDSFFHHSPWLQYQNQKDFINPEGNSVYHRTPVNWVKSLCAVPKGEAWNNLNKMAKNRLGTRLQTPCKADSIRGTRLFPFDWLSSLDGLQPIQPKWALLRPNWPSFLEQVSLAVDILTSSLCVCDFDQMETLCCLKWQNDMTWLNAFCWKWCVL